MTAGNATLPARAFLGLFGVFSVPYGLYCFARPDFLEAFAGIGAVSTTGTIELRAFLIGEATGLLPIDEFEDPCPRRLGGREGGNLRGSRARGDEVDDLVEGRSGGHGSRPPQGAGPAPKAWCGPV